LTAVPGSQQMLGAISALFMTIFCLSARQVTSASGCSLCHWAPYRRGAEKSNENFTAAATDYFCGRLVVDYFIGVYDMQWLTIGPVSHLLLQLRLCRLC